MTADWLDQVNWNAEGLAPVIAQDSQSGQVLMLAWMNRAALAQTISSGQAVYWSRSRQRLWAKGETSGHRQIVNDIRLDCDYDAILLKVEQVGGIACHTGRSSCFFHQLQDDQWLGVEAIVSVPGVRDPDEMYGDQR